MGRIGSNATTWQHTTEQSDRAHALRACLSSLMDRCVLFVLFFTLLQRCRVVFTVGCLFRGCVKRVQLCVRYQHLFTETNAMIKPALLGKVCAIARSSDEYRVLAVTMVHAGAGSCRSPQADVEIKFSWSRCGRISFLRCVCGCAWEPGLFSSCYCLVCCYSAAAVHCLLLTSLLALVFETISGCTTWTTRADNK